MVDSFHRAADGTLLAIWPQHVEPNTAYLQRVHAIADGERVSSAPGITRRLLGEVAAIHANAELSDSGKRARIGPAAEAAFANLAGVASKWRALSAEHEADVAKSVTFAEPTANETAIDLEIARLVRAEAKPTTALTMASERTRRAISRLPVELSGLSEPQRDKIRGSLVDAATALRLEHGREALAAAQDATQRAVSLVARHLPEGSHAERRAAIEPFHL